MGLFNRKKLNPMDIEDEVFEHMLNVFFEFKEKYPTRIVSFGVHPSNKVIEYVAFDIYFIFDGRIDMYKSNETDEMLEFFEQVEYDGTFTTFEGVRNTYETYINRNDRIEKLKARIRHFAKSNPGIEFESKDYGVIIKYW